MALAHRVSLQRTLGPNGESVHEDLLRQHLPPLPSQILDRLAGHKQLLNAVHELYQVSAAQVRAHGEY